MLTAGDAFLIYLNIFSYEEAASKPASKLREEILKMWKEFVPAKEAESVKRLLEPEEKKPAFWNKLLNSTQKLSIAFVYDKKPDTSSWLYAHELGRLHLEEVFPEKVETSCYIGDVEQVSGRWKSGHIYDHTSFNARKFKSRIKISRSTDT